VSGLIAGVVVVGLVALLLAGAISGEPHPATAELPGGAVGILQAATLLFFGFAGYARVATLAGEVRDPRRTLPLAVLAALGFVLVLSFATAFVLLSALGASDLAASTSPLADLVGPGAQPFVAALAGIAAVGALIGVLAGLSRTALAMSRGGDLPGFLGRIAHRTATPVAADVAVALVGAAAALLLEPTILVGFSACAVLGYYGIAHLAALRIEAGPDRWLPAVVPILGLAGCAVLAVTAPWQALVAVVGSTVAALVIRTLVRARGPA
jgi:APA family basic amino acid/polyamine antiporter